MNFNPGWIPLIFQNLKNKFARLDSNGKISENSLPNNISVGSINVTQGTTTEINAINPPSNQIFEDISKARLRLGNTEYAKYSEVLDKAIAPSYISQNYYPIIQTDITNVTQGMEADPLTIFEFFIINRTITLSAISLNVITAGNTTINFALYSTDKTTVKPIIRLTPAYSVSCLTTGQKDVTTNITLEPGVYAIGQYIVGNSAAKVLTAVNSSYSFFYFGRVGLFSIRTIAYLTSTTLPSTLTNSQTFFGDIVDIRAFYPEAILFYLKAA